MIKVKYVDAIAAMKAAVEANGEDFTYQRRADPFGDGACAYVHHDGVALKDGTFTDDHTYQDDHDSDEFDHYVNPTPGCLVGHALILLGVKPDEFGHAQCNIDQRSYFAISMLNTVVVSDKAMKAFSVAQMKQDEGDRWGDALKRAETYNYSFYADDNDDV